MLYIIHFQKRYRHARHYLGFCAEDGLQDRIYQHFIGSGANLIRVVNGSPRDNKKILWHVARVMPGDRARERQIKRVGKKISAYCPHCAGIQVKKDNYQQICRQINQQLAQWQYKKKLISEKALEWIISTTIKKQNHEVQNH